MRNVLMRLFAIVLLTAVVAFCIGIYSSTVQKFETLRKTYYTETQTSSTIYATVWHTARQSANLDNITEEQFRPVYLQSIRATDAYTGTAQLLTWMREKDPNFTPEAYYDYFKVRREEAYKSQLVLNWCYTRLQTLTTTAPSRWFLRGKTIPRTPFVSDALNSI